VFRLVDSNGQQALGIVIKDWAGIYEVNLPELLFPSAYNRDPTVRIVGRFNHEAP